MADAVMTEESEAKSAPSSDPIKLGPSPWTKLTTILAGKNEEEEKFLVHTHVLRQVKWFRVCLEAGMQETQENTIRLPEDCPYAVSELIHWLYHGTFQTNPNDTLDKIIRIEDAEASKDGLKDNAVKNVLWTQYGDEAQVITALYFLAKKMCVEKIQNMAVGIIHKMLALHFLTEDVYVMVCAHEDANDKLRQMLSEDLAFEMCKAQRKGRWEEYQRDYSVFSRFARGDLEHMQFLLEAMMKHPDPAGIHACNSACRWHTHNDTPKCSSEEACSD